MSSTMAILIKEVMANMPDTLDTKKEIDEYFKNAMKDIVKEKKEQEAKAKKAKKEVKSEDEADEAVEAKPKKQRKKKEVKSSEDEADVAGEAKPKKQRKKKEADEADEAKQEDEANEEGEEAKQEDEAKPEKPSPRRFILQPKKKKAKKEADEADEADVAKPKEVDEDGNEIKKPPTEYIIFKKEMGIKIKEMFPDLNYQKTVKRINDLWKIHKAEQQMN